MAAELLVHEELVRLGRSPPEQREGYLRARLLAKREPDGEPVLFARRLDLEAGLPSVPGAALQTVEEPDGEPLGGCLGGVDLPERRVRTLPVAPEARRNAFVEAHRFSSPSPRSAAPGP